MFPAIHIGGTNGKGSVAALIAKTLEVMGHRVALYTSPHLVEVRERITVAGQPISTEAFAMWTAMMQPVIERSAASFFEATTAIAFADFAARGADVAVIEVGLGGRLDATNILRPMVSAVTNVSREHTEYLGNDLPTIAREKAGIAKRGIPFVIGERERDLAEVLEGVARTTGARATRLSPDAEYEGPLRLRGRHQRRNAAIAAAVLRVLPSPFQPEPSDVREAFARTSLPGRFERRGRWIFDVAHNPSGVETLVGALRETAPPRPIHLLAGFLADKDWQSALSMLAEVVDAIWLTQPPSAPVARRWDLESVADAAPRGAQIEGDFDRALHQVQQGSATVLVCGSFHTVGDALARLPGFAPLG